MIYIESKCRVNREFSQLFETSICVFMLVYVNRFNLNFEARLKNKLSLSNTKLIVRLASKLAIKYTET